MPGVYTLPAAMTTVDDGNAGFASYLELQHHLTTGQPLVSKAGYDEPAMLPGDMSLGNDWAAGYLTTDSSLLALPELCLSPSTPDSSALTASRQSMPLTPSTPMYSHQAQQHPFTSSDQHKPYFAQQLSYGEQSYADNSLWQRRQSQPVAPAPWPALSQTKSIPRLDLASQAQIPIRRASFSPLSELAAALDEASRQQNDPAYFAQHTSWPVERPPDRHIPRPVPRRQSMGAPIIETSKHLNLGSYAPKSASLAEGMPMQLQQAHALRQASRDSGKRANEEIRDPRNQALKHAVSAPSLFEQYQRSAWADAPPLPPFPAQYDAYAMPPPQPIFTHSPLQTPVRPSLVNNPPSPIRSTLSPTLPFRRPDFGARQHLALQPEDLQLLNGPPVVPLPLSSHSTPEELVFASPPLSATHELSKSLRAISLAAASTLEQGPSCQSWSSNHLPVPVGMTSARAAPSLMTAGSYYAAQEAALASIDQPITPVKRVTIFDPVGVQSVPLMKRASTSAAATYTAPRRPSLDRASTTSAVAAQYRQPPSTPTRPSARRKVTAPLSGARKTFARKMQAKATESSAAAEDMFINFTANDSAKLLSGVAPSGSSKRRRLEAEDGSLKSPTTPTSPLKSPLSARSMSSNSSGVSGTSTAVTSETTSPPIKDEMQIAPEQ
ncbi:hypothetical protein E5Q_02402 [Mixia osmundae IAM 14324]|uniref:Uncharacterized protein n=1 Tax=Mixia osmundae (strain CBS 9802 / IAM 14324 / JCM 22182 / KY 12970) TaxID=764103 RepID=G7DYT5_MIXOS|nr:hypothetical protein E5Q_02402 [Mixia osmundae IAM 14324]